MIRPMISYAPGIPADLVARLMEAELEYMVEVVKLPSRLTAMLDEHIEQIPSYPEFEVSKKKAKKLQNRGNRIIRVAIRMLLHGEGFGCKGYNMSSHQLAIYYGNC